MLIMNNQFSWILCTVERDRAALAAREKCPATSKMHENKGNISEARLLGLVQYFTLLDL